MVVLICCSVVTLRRRLVGTSGVSEGSGSSSGAGQLDEQTRELISVEIMRSILV